MKIIIKETAADASAAAADMLVHQIAEKPDSFLGLPTGGTPLAVYARLRDEFASGRVSFRELTTFNLDEYLGLRAEDPSSYAYYMRSHLFAHIDIKSSQTHIPNGTALDADAEANRYDALIAEVGGIDLMLLGLGRNAHIGFNEPGSDHASRTRCVALTQSTIEANSAYFAAGKKQPSHAITMGIGTILECRRIVVLATGTEKSDAVEATIKGPASADVPGSALLRHANTTFVLDKAAAQKLERAQVSELEA